jgi:hypothetical protein
MRRNLAARSGHWRRRVEGPIERLTPRETEVLALLAYLRSRPPRGRHHLGGAVPCGFT